MLLMQDFSEIIPYEHPNVPMHIRTAYLSRYQSKYQSMNAPCHWHEDIEWVYIWEGTMPYYINGKRLVLKEKDSLMVNARQMHYGSAFQKQECKFSFIVFHPSLFCNNQPLLEKYVTPVLQNCSLEFLHLHYNHASGQQAADLLTKMFCLKEQAAEGYELEIISLMQILWIRLWQNMEFKCGVETQEMPDDVKAQKEMLSFLYQHYNEKISLDDIAASAHISRSKCCRIFRRYLQQSPIELLNSYRLKASCNMLARTNKTITEIAFACGFNNLSYFSKYFYRNYGCTPREYRNQMHSSTL